MAALRLPAPAKLNLFLHITGRRDDGYHELQTVFQFLNLCDELAFHCRPQPGCQLEGDLCGVPPEHNLVLRAAQALSEHCAVGHGAHITLRKRIPLGGGLGGGSSDAATTLLALNELWQCRLSLDQLAEIGVHIGADVPVFVHGRASFAEGIGERLSRVDLDEPWYLVVYPGCAVNTAAIFNDPELTRNSPPIKIAAFLRQGGRNDCEPVVRRRHPQVDEAINWLQGYASAKLTGTGSCLFAQFPGRESAESVLGKLPLHWRGYVTRGLNRSPTHSALYD